MQTILPFRVLCWVGGITVGEMISSYKQIICLRDKGVLFTKMEIDTMGKLLIIVFWVQEIVINLFRYGNIPDDSVLYFV